MCLENQSIKEIRTKKIIKLINFFGLVLINFMVGRIKYKPVHKPINYEKYNGRNKGLCCECVGKRSSIHINRNEGTI